MGIAQRRRRTVALAVALPLVVATTAAAVPPQNTGVKFEITRSLGGQAIAGNLSYDGTVVGGLSGLDRDPRTGIWYFISDERWRPNPPHFYTGELAIDQKTGKFSNVKLTSRTWLAPQNGSSYPRYGQKNSPDPESIRFDPVGARLLWGSEGHHPSKKYPDALSQLHVRWMDADGKERGELKIPDNLTVTTGTTKGPRTNTGFEGVTLTPGGIAAMVEQPLYQDGEAASAEHGGVVRLTVWKRDGTLAAQYAYPIDPLPAKSLPADPEDNGGVSEILAIDDRRYLALERSWTKRTGFAAKLYEFDVTGATDVLKRDSLATGDPYTPVTKRLVQSFESSGNLESIAFGPKLDSGECTLVIGSDNNFDAKEDTRLLAYAAKGC